MVNPDSETFSDRLALVVVDMQDRVLKALPDGREVLERVSFAVAAAQLLGVNTIFTEQQPDKLGGVNPGLLALAPKHELFQKTAFSALQSPGLAKLLQKRRTEHVLLCGIETPICVYQTALQAMRSELDVTLLSDCHGGRRARDAKAVVRFLEKNGVHALPAETVFYSLLADAKHPRFKEFTKLVKSHGG
jgi:nicotinamidase-related amidase